ncbi:OmpA family protein [Marinilabilia rubra]|uniref:Flagellar motor protein MotB n=1 Tax=Marinilabilia rubra TaxID=2162893 RepID=A0A2U2BB56_9BACT|nr:OmpA family protein [Marinilabilia rubra]PWE00289.1 flagellar motor protein MotB [Marinilabilia rubra]
MKITTQTNKTLFTFFIIIICFAGQGFSQSSREANTPSENRKLQKAQEAIKNMAYQEAIQIFEKLRQKGNLSDSGKEELALTYLKTNNPEKAEDLYFSIGLKFLSTEHLFNYARALRYNGKYEKADRVISRYLEKRPNDTEAKEFQNSSAEIMEIRSNSRYTIEEVGFNSEESDFAPLIQNGILFFTSAREVNPIIKRRTPQTRSPFLNIFRADKQGDHFVSPELYSSDLRTIYHDGPICFNTTGTEIFITRNRFHSVFKKEGKDGNNPLYILRALRKNDGSWSTPTQLPFNSPDYNCAHPFLTRDGKRLFFTSDNPEGYGGSDIFFVNRTKDGWSNPINAGAKINTKGDEMFPYIDENGRFYFASNGHLGLGGLDIFAAEIVDGILKVKNVGYPVNSEKDDFSFFLEADTIHGFFASNRPGGKGSDDIYRFKIENPITFIKPPKAIHYNGLVIDQEKKTRIPGAIVGILDSTGTYIKEVTTNRAGLFQIPDSISGKITAIAAVEHYYPYEETFSLKSLTDTITLAMRPKPVYGITGTIYDSEKNRALYNAELRIVSPGYETDTVFTNNEGKFRARLNPYSTYNITILRRNYFPKKLSYSTTGLDPGYVNLDQSVNLTLERAKIGDTVQIGVDYNGIELMSEKNPGLDDLYLFLKENPGIRIELGAHTDSQGDALDNLKRSRKRAQSATDYLTNKGIAPIRIAPKGYGETQLKNNCKDGVPCSESEHKENERTEIKILEM